MTPNTNVDIIWDYVETVWNRGDMSALERLTTSDFAFQIGSEPERNRAVMAKFVKMIRSAFPDWYVRIVDTITDNNVTVVRWKGAATHNGVFYGIEPTGKQIVISGINIYQFEEDKIKKEWEQMDTLGLLRQLGVLPG